MLEVELGEELAVVVGQSAPGRDQVRPQPQSSGQGLGPTPTIDLGVIA